MQDDDAGGGQGRAERGGQRARQFAGGYEPTRKPRLRSAASEPPPLPFGDAPEDGLRMLAALETLTSLEPDFCDDFAAEASVTIIERVGHDPQDAEHGGGDTRSLRERLHDVEDQFEDGDDDTGPYRTLADEATVEIVEIGDIAADFPAAEEEQPSPVVQVRGGRATSRFFRALSGR